MSPVTVNEPEVSEGAYRSCVPTFDVDTVKGMLPSGTSVKVIVPAVEDCVAPSKVTDQDLPSGKPTSVKVTV